MRFEPVTIFPLSITKYRDPIISNDISEKSKNIYLKNNNNNFGEKIRKELNIII